MIEITALRKAFGSVRVLDRISLRVAEGEVVCVIGPSGSGKSTLLRCINGLESYDGGEITVAGRLVDRRRSDIRDIRRDVAMVFQRFNLFPHRTALQNVTEGPIYAMGESRVEAEARARSLLARVGLAGRENDYPSQLSGGQQQRVAIARALAMRPKAVLFDEPTSALDPELVGEVLAVMRDMAKDGMTMLVVTHEMSFARAVADRVVFIDHGRVIEEGPPDRVLTAPAEQRTRDFLRRILHPLDESDVAADRLC